mgnify:CR=1 FL=1
MPKGSKAALWILAFLYGGMMPDVLWLYVFATVQLTRLSQHRRSAYPRRFSVLRQLRRNRWHLWNNQRFANLTVGWLRECLRSSEDSVRTSLQ